MEAKQPDWESVGLCELVYVHGIRVGQEELVDSVTVDATICNPGGPQSGVFYQTERCEWRL